MRSTLAGYLNKLLGYGVSGFRVDAAKHIGQTDLAAIEAKLHRTVDGDPAVHRAGGRRRAAPACCRPSRSSASGSLLGFDYATQLHERVQDLRHAAAAATSPT